MECIEGQRTDKESLILGSYWRIYREWYAMAPNGMPYRFKRYTVTEHADKTISTDRAFRVYGSIHADTWLGIIDHGVWRENTKYYREDDLFNPQHVHILRLRVSQLRFRRMLQEKHRRLYSGLTARTVDGSYPRLLATTINTGKLVCGTDHSRRDSDLCDSEYWQYAITNPKY